MQNSYFVGDLTNHSAIIDLEGSTLFLGHGHIIGQNLRFLKNSWLLVQAYGAALTVHIWR